MATAPTGGTESRLQADSPSTVGPSTIGPSPVGPSPVDEAAGPSQAGRFRTVTEMGGLVPSRPPGRKATALSV